MICDFNGTELQVGDTVAFAKHNTKVGMSLCKGVVVKVNEKTFRVNHVEEFKHGTGTINVPPSKIVKIVT